MINPPAPLDTIYTADEAADRLRLSKRAVIKLGKKYGLCSVFSRSVLFSERDLLELWQILREPPKAPKPADLRATHPREVHNRLLELTNKRQRERAERQQARREAARVQREQRRLEEKERRDAKAVARTEIVPAASSLPEILDHKNRDPAYWTKERKKRLRREREERVAGIENWNGDQK